jgi:amidophosphoribosyltransferase
MLHEAGAKEVHLKIASPPIKYPDYYGIDTPNKNELLASKLNINEIQKLIGAKTLQFLSIEGLYKSMGYKKRNSSYPQCADHCFTGEYPVKPIDVNDKDFGKNQLSFMSTKTN